MTLELEKVEWFQAAARQNRPVLLYGMGNGAEKILAKCRREGVRVAGLFASDEFVRGQQFAGFQVKSYSQVCREFPVALILVAFGTADPVVLTRIAAMEQSYTVLAPDLALFGEDRSILSFGDELEEAYALYEPGSRDVYVNLLNFKITGRLSYLRAATTAKAEAYGLLKLHGDEVYVDAGAYDGDTIREFLAHLPQTPEGKALYRRIIAIEPEARNFRMLKRWVEESGLKDLELLNVALFNAAAELPFNDKVGRGAYLTTQGRRRVPARRLDDLIREPVTLLKMDVEGVEKEALEGSARILRQDKPRLIISAYHRSGDIVTLPRVIKDLNPDYRIALRQHPYIPAWDTNLYAR
jgi:FkbM family methyltransferase